MTSEAVVQPTSSAISALKPLERGSVTITDGFWSERIATNRRHTLLHGAAHLDQAGNLHDLRLAAGMPGTYRALGLMVDRPFPFLDSDVYKWLEAVGWELGRSPDAELARIADEAIALVAAAQRPDGYLNSFVQVLTPGQEYRDLQWGHELYCYGHLIQAAVAWHRALDDDRLLDVAVRTVDSLERELGLSGREEVDGHPGIEMALVELYRSVGERRYLDLAARLLQRRGHGVLGAGRFGAEYWQDHVPVSEATSVAGHAVRQLYLDCGVVDVATELGDQSLLDAVRRRWRDMIATRMYLTGGLGSRHRGEAFGDPFELPPDRAYAETCAAIASVMLAWRLLLATGDPGCSDLIERTMLNGVLSGLSLDGTRFFYVNPLQRRTHRVADEPTAGERQVWYACACCPPNLMRLLSSWEQYVATRDESGIQLHQYASASVTTDVGRGRVGLVVQSDYPWDGAVHVTVNETPADDWTLSMRVPGWCTTATIDGRPAGAGPWFRETRAWTPGDSVVLMMDMAPRVTEPDPRVDAVRGCVAFERGPIVYCAESADLPAGVELEDIEVDASEAPEPVDRSDVAPGVVGLVMRGRGRDDRAPRDLMAIPYFAWANRSPGAMRVWMPRHDAG